MLFSSKLILKNLIHQLKRQGDSESARKALIQGRRIVSQLEATLRELENVRSSLEAEDERTFSQKIAPTKQRVLAAIQQFYQRMQSTTSSQISTEQIENEPCVVNQHEQQLMLEQINLEDRKAELEAFENLQKDIVELNQLFVEFSKQVDVSYNYLQQLDMHT